MRNAAIIGGGNIGTYLACVLADKGFDVNIYTSRPEQWHNLITAHNDDGSVITGRISLASDNIAKVLNHREIIFITYPASLFGELAKLITPYVQAGSLIGIIPGSGGAEFQFQECINNGAVLFGLQRVPVIARVINYGQSVMASGKKDRLKLAAIPASESQRIPVIISNLFDIPCDSLANYLNVTLTPSNPVLHTSRLRTLFQDYHEGMTYPENFLFYGSWDNEASRLLFELDDELQNLCRVINLDLSQVKSLREHYESNSPEALTRKIQSIESLNKLSSPMKKLRDGNWIPDFDSRYFTSDFPFGLAIIHSIAELFDFNAPAIRQTMQWYREITRDNNCFRLGDFGIDSTEKFYRIYHEKFTQKGLDKMISAATIDKTRQDKTRQDKTRQDKTRQDKTRQDKL